MLNNEQDIYIYTKTLLAIIQHNVLTVLQSPPINMENMTIQG